MTLFAQAIALRNAAERSCWQPCRGWQITVDDKLQKLLNFNGKVSSGAALSAKWKIRVTPTVLFFDIKGTEIAGRLQAFPLTFTGPTWMVRSTQPVSSSKTNKQAAVAIRPNAGLTQSIRQSAFG